MAREARKISPQGLYIVELDGGRLFQNDDDKKVFIETAEKYFSDGGKIYGCSLTDTAAKMAVKESVKGISMAMKSLSVSYARYFNKTYQTNGPLFSGRFKSVPLYSEADAEEAAKNLDAPSAERPKTPAKKPAAKKPAAKAAPKASANKPESAAKENAAQSAPEQKPKPKKKSLPSWLL